MPILAINAIKDSIHQQKDFMPAVKLINKFFNVDANIFPKDMFTKTLKRTAQKLAAVTTNIVDKLLKLIFATLSF